MCAPSVRRGCRCIGRCVGNGVTLFIGQCTRDRRGHNDPANVGCYTTAYYHSYTSLPRRYAAAAAQKLFAYTHTVGATADMHTAPSRRRPPPRQHVLHRDVLLLLSHANVLAWPQWDVETRAGVSQCSQVTCLDTCACPKWPHTHTRRTRQHGVAALTTHCCQDKRDGGDDPPLHLCGKRLSSDDTQQTAPHRKRALLAGRGRVNADGEPHAVDCRTSNDQQNTKCKK